MNRWISRTFLSASDWFGQLKERSRNGVVYGLLLWAQDRTWMIAFRFGAPIENPPYTQLYVYVPASTLETETEEQFMARHAAAIAKGPVEI